LMISVTSCLITVQKKSYNKAMKGKRSIIILIFSIAVLSFTSSSCTFGNRLQIKAAAESDLTGNFDLILYGCNYHDQFDTLAILVKEDGPYGFEPFAPDFNYRIIKGLPAEDAMDQAQKFVNCNTAFHTSRLSMLVSPTGDTLGFEVRPLYLPFVFGVEDALDTAYWIKDGKVLVKIRLLPSIEHMLSGGSNGRDRD
jgi:hypothetical protein